MKYGGVRLKCSQQNQSNDFWLDHLATSIKAQIGPSLLCSIPMTGLILASPGATTTSLGCNGLGRCSINGGGLTMHHNEVMLVLLVDSENWSKHGLHKTDVLGTVVWNHGILWLSHILGIIIIPTDERIFFRGVETTNQRNENGGLILGRWPFNPFKRMGCNQSWLTSKVLWIPMLFRWDPFDCCVEYQYGICLACMSSVLFTSSTSNN